MSHNNKDFLNARYKPNKPMFVSQTSHLQNLYASGRFDDLKNYIYYLFRKTWSTHTSQDRIFWMFSDAKCEECDTMYRKVDMSLFLPEDMTYILEAKAYKMPPKAFHEIIRVAQERVVQSQINSRHELLANRRIRESKGIAEYGSTTYSTYQTLLAELETIKPSMTVEEAHFYESISQAEIPELIATLDQITELEAYSKQANELETILQLLVQEFTLLLKTVNERKAAYMSTSMENVAELIKNRMKDRTAEREISETLLGPLTDEHSPGNS